ncbi:MAG: hypothetical protein D3923_08890 [Candidatus Electrothrix sp. AR3]|nr:hypothetical protein [Candidatus Electrothrix sp. AR3]
MSLSNKFDHFLLTRFNVLLNLPRHPEVIASKRLNQEWLKNRFELFEQYCLPSILSQSNQNFKWLVMFDSKIPDDFKERNQKHGLNCPNYIPIYMDNYTIEKVKNSISKRLDKEKQFLITTRLDNDDAVCKNYVQMIQDCFCCQKKESINFTKGYILNHKKNKLYRAKYYSNPFVSLIEKADNFQTVYIEKHDQLHKIGSVREIRSNPAWLQCIHGDNIYNFLFGIRQPIKKLSDNFSVNLDCDQYENKYLILKDQVACYASKVINRFF